MSPNTDTDGSKPLWTALNLEPGEIGGVRMLGHKPQAYSQLDDGLHLMTGKYAALASRQPMLTQLRDTRGRSMRLHGRDIVFCCL